MSELTPDREQEIRDRRSHITDAPWGSRGDGNGGNTVQSGAYVTLEEGFASSGDVAHILGDTPEHNYRRATFIARAPRDIDDLLTELDRLRKQNAELDKACDEVIGERDHLHDVADKLAYAIAPIEVIGEHSSENDPWENALDHITPAVEVDRLRAELAARPTRAEVLRRAADSVEQVFMVGVTPATERNKVWDEAVRAVSTDLRRMAVAAERGEQS